MVRSLFFTENLWHTFLFSLHPSLCYYYVSAHKDNVNIGIFFNQIRNCILRTTLCASGAKTNNRCLSVCICFWLHVCVQVYRCDTWRSPWSESQAPDWFESGAQVHRIELRRILQGSGIPCSARHTYRGIHAHPHRERNTHTVIHKSDLNSKGKPFGGYV